MNMGIKRIPLALLGTVMVGLTAGPAGAAHLTAQSGGEMSQVARGASVYGNMCGRCHNPRSPLERDDRDWVTIINHMRTRGNLTGGQVRTVLAFLQAMNTNPAGEPGTAGPRSADASTDPISVDAALIAAGETLITAKACIGCHLVRGGGGNIGPTLDGVTGRRDPVYLRRKLIDPTFDNAISMMPNLGLTEREIESILAYLATLGERR